MRHLIVPAVLWVCITSCAVSAEVAWPTVEQIAAVRHELEQSRPPITDERNAAILWDRAADEAVLWRWRNDSSDAQIGFKFLLPEGRSLRRLRRYAAANTDAVRLFAQGVERDGCRTVDSLSLGEVRQLANLHLLHARLALHDGDGNKAVDHLLVIRGAGMLIFATAERTIDLLFGAALVGLANDGLRRSVSELPREELRRALDVLLAQPLELRRDHQVRIIRDTREDHLKSIEEWETLLRKTGLLAAQPGTKRTDAERVLGALIGHELVEPARAIMLAGRFKAEAGRAIQLVDHAAVDDAAMRMHALSIASVELPWAESRQAMRMAEQEAAQMRAAVITQLDRLEKELAAAEPDQRVRDRLADDLTGALDRLGLAMSIGMLPSVHSKLRETVAYDHATGLVLALELHRREHGDYPDRLEMLLAVGLLPAVPRDPFGEGPLGFDRAANRIWSVGENGVDDGERDADQHRGDIVWPIQPLPRVAYPTLDLDM